MKGTSSDEQFIFRSQFLISVRLSYHCYIAQKFIIGFGLPGTLSQKGLEERERRRERRRERKSRREARFVVVKFLLIQVNVYVEVKPSIYCLED